MSYIKLNNISLMYPVYGSSSRNFKTALINLATGGMIEKHNEIVHVKALNNISLSLSSGDKLALLGHNGAGKSTLLKTIAQIYAPSEGSIEINGSTSCLFDLMMGMDPEITGKENIVLRARIAGLTKKQAQDLICKVEEFAELGNFINMPFKTYSAGMQIRLAFGIITNIHAKIILIDEVINVGDQKFIKKAQEQIENLVNKAEILVLSTHDIHTAKKLCNKALWLNKGSLIKYGEINSIAEEFTQSNNSEEALV